MQLKIGLLYWLVMAEKLWETRQGHQLCVTNFIRELIEQIKEDQDEARLIKLEPKRLSILMKNF